MSAQEPEPPPIDPAHELPEPPEGTAASEETRRLIAERDALQDRLLRALADADNARKRATRELNDARAYAAAEAVRPFLPVLDGFDRAAQHRDAEAQELRKGLELLHRQLLDAARKVGLEAVPAVDQPFDPHLHEAIEVVETDQAPDGTVVEELQRGYTLRDRLVRPAMVKVARGKAS
ncbi:MAG: nucleotide exchange factor GrpE [Terriglobales bacterium]